MLFGMVIAVDFDGTCVRHEFPKIGPEVPGAAATLRALVAAGHRLILWTVRDGAYLAEALEWFRARNLELWGVNENPDQGSWNSSRKVYAEAYLDDAAHGCPLLREPGEAVRPYVDWAPIWCSLVGDWPDAGAPVGWWPEESRPKHLPAAQADGVGE